MINGIKIKVCGLTRASDAKAAADLGADFLGFIFYRDSPRGIDLEDFERLLPDLPDIAKVAVTVAPDNGFLDALISLGFSFFQIHFDADSESIDRIRSWSEKVGPEKLWLAPKIAPGHSFNRDWFELADTWLCDAYRKEVYGGTGVTGDWKAFRAFSRDYPEKKWVLAGGLGPENIAEAIEQTGAKHLDLNSGLERSPGIKDQYKMKSVRLALENR